MLHCNETASFTEGAYSNERQVKDQSCGYNLFQTKLLLYCEYRAILAPCVHHMKYDSSMLIHFLISLIHWHDAVLPENPVTIWLAKAEFISVLQHTSWSALSCSPPGSPTALQRSC